VSNEFPAFIKAEYVEGDAFSRFQRDYEQATQGFRQKFAEASQEAQRLLSQAIALPRNNVGSLDLGVPQLRAAAEAQQARAIAAREVANATAIAAKAEGDYSAQARAALAATQALAREEEEAARAARAHADAAEQVQRALNLQKSATDLVVQSTARGTTATRINTESQRANRFAMIQAGQQLQDIAISLQSGQRATTVFAQQLPQLAFAFTDVGGKAGQVAQFLAGPWGVAVFAGVTALGFLIERLVETSDFMKSTGDEAERTSNRIAAAMQRLTAFGQAASEMTKLFTDSSEVRIDAAAKEARAARLEIDAQRARQEAARPGLGAEKEFTDRRALAIKRAQAAEAEAKALRSEAAAQKASADAALRAVNLQKRNDEIIRATGTAVSGGGGGGSRSRGGGGGVDRTAAEAARELQQLESKIQSLESQLDPATTAAREFADALDAINMAAERGIISTGRAQELSTAAIFAQDRREKAQQSAEIDRFMQIYTPVDLTGIVETSEEYSRRIAEKWKESQSDAANEFANALQAMDIFKALISGRGGLLRALAGGVLGVGGSKLQEGFSAGYANSIGELQNAFSGALEKIFGKDAENIGKTLGSFAVNGQIGSQIAGVTGGNRTAGALGGVLGSELGKSLAKGPLGSALGKLSGALGPLGGIVGGIALGALSSALTPAKRGSATIGGSGGQLIVSSTRGNSRSRIAQSSDSAGEAITTLERIAEALGGTIDASRGSVSIGVRDKNFRVDTTGSGITKTKRGAIDFGQDSAAAIKFATMDLIKDGVITGIRASTQRLLQNSKDLDDAIRKATDFQSVFDRLQDRLDPVGAAITRVEREFTRLRQIFGEAAASAEEYADLEKLYQLERQDAIKEANDRVLGSMKALLDDLRFGDNGRSLRDRLAAAQAKFDPLAARVQAGDITAYDDFAEAARALLDIQRQFSGSQTAFFELQDRITAITAKAVEGGNVTSILSASAIPSAQAQSQLSYDGSNVVAAIDQLGDRLVQVLGGQLVEIRENTTPGPIYSGSGGGFNVPGMFVQNVRQI
jgi:hypothetical protein